MRQVILLITWFTQKETSCPCPEVAQVAASATLAVGPGYSIMSATRLAARLGIAVTCTESLPTLGISMSPRDDVALPPSQVTVFLQLFPGVTALVTSSLSLF